MSPRQICAMDRLKKWWVLSGVEGVGPVKLKDWIESVGSLEECLESSQDGRIPSFASQARERLGFFGADIVRRRDFGQCHGRTKPILAPWRELRDAPVVVFGSGNQRAMNDRPFAAVVGTRDCSQRAAELGFEVGRFLAGQDWGVVSGLARGVDAMAHRGACYAEGLDGRLFGESASTLFIPGSIENWRGKLSGVAAR